MPWYYWLVRILLIGIILVAIVVGGIAFIGRSVTVEAENGDTGITNLITTPYRAFTRGLVAITGGEANENTYALLILGKAGDGWTAGELTDTILLAILDGPRARGTLFSIPRDLYVEYRNGYQSKINTLWQTGKTEARWQDNTSVEDMSELIRIEVEDITGIKVDEVLVVDVMAVETVVDELGGIAIDVRERLIDPRYPTPGGGVERLEIQPGFQVLDGQTAVKYARTRRTREGDFGRIRRQQQVIEAIIAKGRGLKITEDFGTILSTLTALGGHVQTTLSLEELAELASLSRTIEFSNVKTYALESFKAKRLKGEPPILVGAGHSYALQPRKGFENYEEIREIVADLLK